MVSSGASGGSEKKEEWLSEARESVGVTEGGGGVKVGSFL